MAISTGKTTSWRDVAIGLLLGMLVLLVAHQGHRLDRYEDRDYRALRRTVETNIAYTAVLRQEMVVAGMDPPELPPKGTAMTREYRARVCGLLEETFDVE